MINDLAKLTRRILDTVKRGARTAVNGTVQAFNPAAQSIDAHPDVSENVRIEGALKPIPTLTIPGVPVLMVGGQSFGITYGIQPGDRVLLVHRHRSHNEVDSGAAVPLEPRSGRRSNLSDLIGIPGYHPPATERPAERFREDGEPVVFVAEGAPLRIGVSTAAIALSRDDLVQAELAAIAARMAAVEGAIEVWSDAMAAALAAPPYVAPVPPLPGPYNPGPTDTSRVLVDA